MSKKSQKSKKKREERKQRKLSPVRKPADAGFVDAKTRASCLRSIVRQIPSDLRQVLTRRCGSPETVSFLLVADPSVPPPGPSVTPWPMSLLDRVAVLFAPGSEDKVVVDSFVLCGRKGDPATGAAP